jgi:hypothetical protein
MACHRLIRFAIAHGLEELCEVAAKPTKKKRAKKGKVKEAVLGEERVSLSEKQSKCGTGVICETRTLRGAVIPAKAEIYSTSHWKCAADGLDSRFRGNDQCFEGDPIPNDTSTQNVCILLCFSKTSSFGALQDEFWDRQGSFSGSRWPLVLGKRLFV